jgi:hypothetical protein
MTRWRPRLHLLIPYHESSVFRAWCRAQPRGRYQLVYRGIEAGGVRFDLELEDADDHMLAQLTWT